MAKIENCCDQDGGNYLFSGIRSAFDAIEFDPENLGLTLLSIAKGSFGDCPVLVVQDRVMFDAKQLFQMLFI